MERWSGVLKVPLNPNSRAHLKVAASLCFSPIYKTLSVPFANAIFFNGDRVEGTGNQVIERLSDIQRIADILVSKFGGSINAWVIEASTFNGPFAVYKELIPSVNQQGEPKLYDPIGFPASTSAVTLLSYCLEEVKKIISGNRNHSTQAISSVSSVSEPKTFLLGFSKGGTILNQLLTELGSLEPKSHGITSENLVIPCSNESFLNSITEIHYVDVGLNCAGAYVTDGDIIKKISDCVMQGVFGIRFIIHGTPRQWCDSRRAFIRTEKEKMVYLLEREAQRSGGKLQVSEKFYFGDKSPSLQMHFEIIEALDVS